jgi:PAS domain S-box-containing protein
LECLFNLSPQMLCIAGLDGFFKRVNPAFERTLGYSMEELLSRPFVEFVHPDDREASLGELRQLSQGMPTVHFENRYRCKDGRDRWLSWTSSPGDEEGLVYATAVDITEQKRWQEEIQTDLEVHKVIGSILRLSLEPNSLEELLTEALDLLFSISWIGLESKGAVFLVEEEPGVLVMKAQRGLGPEVVDVCREVPFGECLCGRAVADCQLLFVDDVDSRHDRHYAGMSPHGHYCVPLLSDGQPFGLINLYVARGHQRSPKEELFLSSVANVLVGAVKRKRAEESLRYQQAQLLAAQTIQKHLLPSAPPRLPGFDIAAGWRPSELVSGDYYDYLPMPDGSMAFVMGDVSGHGLAPALLMASTRSLIRSLVHTNTDVSRILAVANSMLAGDTGDDRFVTMLLAKLDYNSRRLTFASAGHPAGYVLDASGALKACLESTALPLSVLAEHEFPAGEPIELESGDLILLLTDGVLEAGALQDEAFGDRRVLEVLRQNSHRSAREVQEALLRAATGFCGHHEPADDLTAMVIKVLDA